MSNIIFYGKYNLVSIVTNLILRQLNSETTQNFRRLETFNKKIIRGKCSVSFN